MSKEQSTSSQFSQTRTPIGLGISNLTSVQIASFNIGMEGTTAFGTAIVNGTNSQVTNSSPDGSAQRLQISSQNGSLTGLQIQSTNFGWDSTGFYRGVAAFNAAMGQFDNQTAQSSQVVGRNMAEMGRAMTKTMARMEWKVKQQAREIEKQAIGMKHHARKMRHYARENKHHAREMERRATDMEYQSGKVSNQAQTPRQNTEPPFPVQNSSSPVVNHRSKRRLRSSGTTTIKIPPRTTPTIITVHNLDNPHTAITANSGFNISMGPAPTGPFRFTSGNTIFNIQNIGNMGPETRITVEVSEETVTVNIDGYCSLWLNEVSGVSVQQSGMSFWR